MKASDYADIRHLVDRYSIGVTTRDVGMIASVFAVDGVWKVAAPFNVEIRGNDLIARTIEQSIREYELIVQLACSVVVEIDGDTATTSCLMQEVARSKDKKSGLTMFGIYSDRVVRTSNGWRFAERSFQPHLIDDQPPRGNVLV